MQNQKIAVIYCITIISKNIFINKRNTSDVSFEVGFLKEDVKKFSHVLRDFRNYIHPYHQMSRNFLPDEHTAKICFQVLKAALFQISTNVK